MADCILEKTLTDAKDTADLAADIAAVLAPGDVLLLEGPIGSGKSTFARAAIQARLGRLEDVPSPTFTLVQVYEDAAGDLWHCDLYRLSDSQEVFELGLDDAFVDAISLIEWPDRLGEATPEDALTLRFSAGDPAHSLSILGPEQWRKKLRHLDV